MKKLVLLTLLGVGFLLLVVCSSFVSKTTKLSSTPNVLARHADTKPNTLSNIPPKRNPIPLNPNFPSRS